MAYDIQRARWRVSEILDDGKACLAIILHDEHLPYLNYKQARLMADLLECVETGSEALRASLSLSLGDEVVRITTSRSSAIVQSSAEHRLRDDEAALLAGDLRAPLAAR